MNESEKFLYAMDRELHVVEVNNALALYRSTGDARAFWRAFLLIHARGEAIPAPMLAKLAKWAEAVQDAEKPADVLAALEFAGDETSHIGPKQTRSFEKRWEVASEVNQLLVLHQRQGLKVTAAIHSVAKRRRMTPAKVSKWFYEVFPKGRGTPQTSTSSIKLRGRAGERDILDQTLQSAWR